MRQYIYHTLKPVWNQESKVLILGSIPSPKSRETNFYYGHPQNRFWKVLSYILNEPSPTTNQEKENFLYRHHIALWDVIESCSIDGASDASIRDAVPNPIEQILNEAPIEEIYCTGKQAYRLYEKLCYPRTGRKAVCLPSTSPANCAVSIEKLMAAYAAISEHLKD